MNEWTELYPAKNQRVEHRDKGPWKQCDECRCFQGHAEDCSKVTKEHLIRLLRKSRQDEERARKRAANNLRAVQAMHGKLAMMKHEIAVLRKKLKSGL